MPPKRKEPAKKTKKTSSRATARKEVKKKIQTFEGWKRTMAKIRLAKQARAKATRKK